MSGHTPLTYRQHEGVKPPTLSEATRLPGNFYDAEGKRIALFGTKHALLFAAAPDLLEAAKQAMKVWPDQMRGSTLEAAIAKAEGR